MSKLRAILICPSEPLTLELRTCLEGGGTIELTQALDQYPSSDAVTRMIDVRRPQIVFLSSQDIENFERIARRFQKIAPGLPIVSLGGPADSGLLLRLMHLGIREHLTSPIQAEQIDRITQSMSRQSGQKPAAVNVRGDLYSFLPARGGVGASTLASSVSCVVANEMGLRTLLIDGDLATGTIQFQLKLSNRTTIIDALARAGNLDESLWADLVGNHDQLDVLHAGRSDYYPDIPQTNLDAVLSTARQRYRIICADLGTNICAFTETLLRESRQVFLVTSPSLSALHLSLGRLRRLTEMGLRDQVSVLLNRNPHAHGMMSNEEAAKILGMAPLYSFFEDTEGAAESVLEGEPISKDSEFGRNVAKLAKSLVPSESGPGPSLPGRRFLNYFRLPLREEAGAGARN